MIRRFLFLAALAASAPSWSAVTLSNFPPNPGVLPGGGWQFTSGTTFANPTPARAWVNGVYGGVPAAVVTDTFALKGPAGAFSAAVTSSATAPSIAAALARVAGRAHLALSLGMAAYDLLSGVGVRQGAVGAEIDAGAEKVDKLQVNCSLSSGPAHTSSGSSFGGCYTSVIEKANNYWALDSATIDASNYATKTTVTINPRSCTTSYCYADTVSIRWTRSVVCSGGCVKGAWVKDITTNGTVSISASSTTAKACPEIVDALTGQTSVPGTYSDGKCITGRYTAATDAQVIARVSPGVQADPSAAAKAAADAGASIESSPYSVSGPASQSGTPTSKTTTGPAGTTTVTTTPTYSYTYSGDTITINTTNTTSTTNITNEGDTTTTTETTTTPGNDDKGMCSLYPDSLACMKPGTPPDAEQIPIDRRPVTITKDPRWAANAGACTRGAIQLTSGASINLWQPFCDFFALIRGVVVGMFGLAGAFIFRNGVK